MNAFFPSILCPALSVKGVLRSRTIMAGVILWSFLAVLSASSLWAAESAVIDFPLDSSLPISPSMTAPPRQLSRPDGAGYTEIYLAPVTEGQALAVTVVFEDAMDESPALFWVDAVTGKQTTLSSELSDGVAGLNQRTILVPPEVAANAGRLVISGDQRNLKRVRLDWAAPSQVLVSADAGSLRLISGERSFQSADLSGERELSPPDAWYGDVLEASLQEEPVALDGAVEFVAPLPQHVDQALLRARFLGLPLQDTVEVWINGTDAGAFHPVVPGLSDPGYVSGSKGETEYSGWRDGALLIPAALLNEGDNSIVLKTFDAKAYVRDATLQLKAHAITHPTTEGIAIGETQDLAPQ